MSHDRQQRCEEQYTKKSIIEINITNNKFPNFTIDGKNKYADDVMGLIRDVYASYAKNGNDPENDKIVELLNQAIFWADRRGVRRHGYSGSEEEKNYVVPYDKKDYQI